MIKAQVRIIQHWPRQGSTMRHSAHNHFEAEMHEDHAGIPGWRKHFGSVGGLVIPQDGKIVVEHIDCAPEEETK